MIRPHIAFTRVSRNAKTGPIPVTTSSEETCPPACPLKGAGCYAEGGPLAMFWRKVTERKAGMAWADAMRQIAKLPKGTLWRHNQAGDLPGLGNDIDPLAFGELVKANRGRRGFTYTHKPASLANMTMVRIALREGFTVNLSADNLAMADELASTGAPVVVVLPSDQTTAVKTPAGRHVAICPATISDDVTCASCGLCAEAGRKSIIGFPAHGNRKAKASAIARSA
jgi:hypothetical protein